MQPRIASCTWLVVQSVFNVFALCVIFQDSSPPFSVWTQPKGVGHMQDGVSRRTLGFNPITSLINSRINMSLVPHLKWLHTNEIRFFNQQRLGTTFNQIRKNCVCTASFIFTTSHFCAADSDLCTVCSALVTKIPDRVSGWGNYKTVEALHVLIFECLKICKINQHFNSHFIVLLI